MEKTKRFSPGELLGRVCRRLAHLPDERWGWYIRLGINNLRVNRRIRPLSLEEVGPIPKVKTGSFNLTEAEYRKFLGLESLAAYRAYDYPHTKVLEYLATYRLTRAGPGSVVLDAAGGGGEYCRALLELHDYGAVFCQDSELASRSEGRIRYLGGSVESIDLADASVSALSCHHSLEHFQGDIDSRFIVELCRLLMPGGIACIVPLFLTDGDFEVWNVRPRAKYDTRATTLWDPLSTFPGWGPHEHFARTYLPDTFRRRIVDPAPEGVEIELLEIRFEGGPCPDMKRNRHQPRLNERMKALVLRKPPETL